MERKWHDGCLGGRDIYYADIFISEGPKDVTADGWIYSYYDFNFALFLFRSSFSLILLPSFRAWMQSRLYLGGSY